jgi:hypothetical protein
MKHSPLVRSRVLGIRLDPDEYQAVEETARKYGLDTADFARLLLTAEWYATHVTWVTQQDWLERDRQITADDAFLLKRAQLFQGIVAAVGAGKTSLGQIEDIAHAALDRIIAALQELRETTQEGSRR